MPAFNRLWRRFMRGRVAVAVVLLALLLAMRMWTGGAVPLGAVIMVIAYLMSTVYAAMRLQPPEAGRPFDPHWAVTVGMDLLVFSLLQLQSSASVSFWPLFGLPVLTAAVLGSVMLALATAAASTLLLLAEAWRAVLDPSLDAAPRLAQAGLTGTAYFAVALLANQLAARLTRLEDVARRSQEEAVAQAIVNALVMETMGEGVLVIDGQGQLRAANPAARSGLGLADRRGDMLGALPSIEPSLLAVARRCTEEAQALETEVDLDGVDGPLRVRVRARLAGPLHKGGDALCVLFVHDLRELQARLRTERLAAMGSVSAAIAHEIRNPLSAITQANALLAEDLVAPGQRQLTELVAQNAQRLARVVDDVLGVGAATRLAPTHALMLDDAMDAIVAEWTEAQAQAAPVRWIPGCGGVQVLFDREHLRRLSTNLLDNARRFASDAPGAIQVLTSLDGDVPVLAVWSDGAPLDAAVQRRLFEPFFSSDPRSTGLGLFICRELCQRHEAEIAHGWVERRRGGNLVPGNEFQVRLRKAGALADSSRFDTMPA